MNEPHTLPADPPVPASPSEWMARIDAQAERALASLERARTFTHDIATLRGVGTFRGVTVEVDAHGRLIRTGFDTHALASGSTSLSTSVSTAYTAATRHVVAQVQQAASVTWADEPGTGARVVDELANRLEVLA